MASQRPESQQQQSSEMDWMRQQMAQMQAMMEQMSRTRPVDPEELERQRQHEREMAQIQLQIAEAEAKAKAKAPADLGSIQIIHKENKVAEFRMEIATRKPKFTLKLEG